MEETVFYIAEGNSADKHSQESFALATSAHTSQQHASFRQANCPQHGAVLSGVGTGERLFAACQNKALINVYSWGKEGLEQRFPVPEELTTLALCNQPNNWEDTDLEAHNLPNFRTPWLLAGGSKSGKIYIWELSSGNLLYVKDAHYQAVSVLKFSKCGTFIVSGGLDARCIVWRTADMISVYNKNDNPNNVKPYATFIDHTLPVTDIIISESGVINDMKLYTVSHDATIRIYDIITRSLFTTFVLNTPIECITKDPANRALYIGLANGLIRSIPLFQINRKTSVLEGVGGNGKIITLDSDPNLESSFVHHQQRLSGSEKSSVSVKNNKKEIEDKPILVTRIAISFDGTSLISGDSIGRVFLSDITTRQVLKTFTPSNSPISYIEVCATPIGIVSSSKSFKAEKKNRLMPQLKRVLTNGESSEHQLYMEIPKKIEAEGDFEDWLSKKSQEELEFKNLSGIKSSVTIANSDSLSTDGRIKDLEEKLNKVSHAYTELRSKHQSLIDEIKNK